MAQLLCSSCIYEDTGYKRGTANERTTHSSEAGAALDYAASLVVQFGPQYTPVFDKLEEALIAVRRQYQEIDKRAARFMAENGIEPMERTNCAPKQ
jgi:hypothetical protein